MRRAGRWETVICNHLVSWIKELCLFIYIHQAKPSVLFIMQHYNKMLPYKNYRSLRQPVLSHNRLVEEKKSLCSWKIHLQSMCYSDMIVP